MQPEEDHPLTKHFVAAVNVLIEQHGFQFPIYMASVAANGSVLAGTLTGQGFEITAEHDVGDMYVLPINVMFVDSITGNAARVLINNPGQTAYTIN